VLDHPLTIVLPVHNCERQLRSSVQDILDLAPAMPSPLDIVVVDDGSTDDTYETACEIARLYPQITVLRQSIRQGLAAALDLVRNRLAVERVLVHDGISVIDAGQLQTMLQSDNTEQSVVEKVAPPISTTETSGSRRFEPHGASASSDDVLPVDATRETSRASPKPEDHSHSNVP